MRRSRVDIEVTSLAISEAKEAYIATKGVRFTNILEVLRNQPRFFVSYNERGERFAMLDRTLPAATC